MRYDAFISYRHSELDSFVAKNIHKSLETFKVPKAVAKKSGKKSETEGKTEKVAAEVNVKEKED